MRFYPIRLNSEGTQGTYTGTDYTLQVESEGQQLWYETRGLPSVAYGDVGLEVLEVLKMKSSAEIEIRKEGELYVGHLVL